MSFTSTAHMSTDESTILFPVDKLKAETLRSIAKDLGVVPGGKKTELLQRLRTSSASHWTTPIKRKSSAEAFETITTTKKSRTAPKTSATLVPLSSPSRIRLRIEDAEAVEKSPHQDLSEDDPSTEKDALNEETPHVQSEQFNLNPRSNVFDDYLIFGPTSVFMTGDDLLTMVDQVPVTALTLWKVISTTTERDEVPLATIDHWLIPAHGSDQIQNVTAFKEAHKDVLETLRKLKAAEANGRLHKAPAGAVTSNGAQPFKRRWYGLSISRNLGKGALAVTLIRGTVQGKGIFPASNAKEESGTFWLSGLSAARQDDSETLEREADLLI